MLHVTDDVMSLTLSRREAQLLEAHLARHLARVEDVLSEAREGHSVLAEELKELRRVDERLQRLLSNIEPPPDLV
jgi:hypothetical protein